MAGSFCFKLTYAEVLLLGPLWERVIVWRSVILLKVFFLFILVTAVSFLYSNNVHFGLRNIHKFKISTKC